MKRRTIIISLIVLVGLVGIYVILSYLREFSGPVSSDITKHNLTDRPEKFEVRIEDNAKFPDHMDLKMSGKINGVGILSFGWNDKASYQKATIADNFNVEYKGDWYSDICIIKYEPISATKGELTIDYTIFSLGRK